MTVYPCFTYLYSPMFHVTKRTTTRTTWDSVLGQYITANTNLENNNTTVVTDWCSFIVPCPCEAGNLDEVRQSSWSPIRFADQLNNEVAEWYIQECLYSRHMKIGFYTRYRKVMPPVLYEFGFIHYKTIEGANPRMFMTYIKRYLSQFKLIQRQLRTTSLSHMANIWEEATDVCFDMLG